MATARCTIESQGWGNVGLNYGYGTSPIYAGKTPDGTAFVSALKFTTPAFTGVLESITFTVVAGKSGYDEATAKLRYAICTSDANASKYSTDTLVSDEYQVVSGVTEVAGGLSAYDTTNNIVISTSNLQPNTTYYLMLWAADEAAGYCCGMGLKGIASDAPYATLTFYNTYELSISAETGSVVSVTRDGLMIGNGATITHGDVLVVNFAASPGYKITSTSHENGSSITVTGDVHVYATADVLSYSIGNGSTMDPYHICIGNGTSYDKYVAYIGNGETWELYE